MGERFDIARAVAEGQLVVEGRAEQSMYPERRFTVCDRLITVDAPDGSGKGVFAKIICDQMALKYGKDNVLLAKPTRFDDSPEARSMQERLMAKKDLASDSVRHNIHFMAALMLNYKTVVIPALDSGKIVVVDSSEVRSLAFMLDRGTPSAIASTLRWIRSGTATAGIIAGNRVIVNATPEDCLANIDARGKRDYGDPINIEEAKRRLSCYDIAFASINRLNTDTPVNIIAIDNPRVEIPNISTYLSELVSEQIIPKIRL